MKWVYLFSLFFIALVVAQDSSESSEESEESDGLQLAEPCNEETCQLPDCRCSITSIPGGLFPRHTPQLVTFKYDDNINVRNMETYRSIMYGRHNANGCPVRASFFVCHEYTNYQLVNELYNNGFEIALHSISHKTDQVYWRDATFEDMMLEFGDQKKQMSYFANIPYEELKGVRIPFLQMTGNSSFEVMAEVGLTYDTSWPTINFVNPGLWPYTLDYASNQDCIVPPCPTASIPGVWVLPIISWVDLQGGFCSFADACFPDNRPALNDEEGWFQFILTNFERHYTGTRAPFGINLHEAFVGANPAIRQALVRFMDLINNLNDVFMGYRRWRGRGNRSQRGCGRCSGRVIRTRRARSPSRYTARTPSETYYRVPANACTPRETVGADDVIDWVKDPIPLNEYMQKPCRTHTPTACPASSCTLQAEHNGNTYWAVFCTTCPRVYPWVGNPLGE